MAQLLVMENMDVEVTDPVRLTLLICNRLPAPLHVLIHGLFSTMFVRDRLNPLVMENTLFGFPPHCNVTLPGVCAKILVKVNPAMLFVLVATRLQWFSTVLYVPAASCTFLYPRVKMVRRSLAVFILTQQKPSPYKMEGALHEKTLHWAALVDPVPAVVQSPTHSVHVDDSGVVE